MFVDDRLHPPEGPRTTSAAIKLITCFSGHVQDALIEMTRVSGLVYFIKNERNDSAGLIISPQKATSQML